MIETLITELVQTAPAMSAVTIQSLMEALFRDGRPLARSIARVVELVGSDLVDPGIALPALASACSTLVRGPTDREREVARFEIETLMPVPDREKPVVPDVPLTSLRRR